MLTTVITLSPDANAAALAAGTIALGEPGIRKAARFFTDEFLAVALFSGIGLLVSLVAVVFGEQGVWF
jgi:hypothetical protein